MTTDPTIGQAPGHDRSEDPGDVPRRGPGRAAALLVVVYALMTAPALVLLPMAGWPDFAQGASAGEALPLIRDNEAAFRSGYLLFMVAGLLYWPATFIVIRALGGRLESPMLSLAGGLAVASAATRAAWYGASLTAFPILDRLWLDAESAATRDAIDVVFIVLNDVLSTVQEDLGVNILGATAGLLISLVILRTRRFPRRLGVAGLLSAVLYLLSSAELLGLQTGAVGDTLAIAAPTVSNLWYVAVAVLLWRRAGRPAPVPASA